MLDQDPRPGAAVLSRVAEHGHGRGHRRLLDVGVGEDDVGGLPSELQGHPLDRLRRQLPDALAHLGRPGERDLGHVRMLDHPFAHGPARSYHHVQDAVGQPHFLPDAFELQRGERGQLSRLQHDRVAGRQRGGDLRGLEP
jgi:hypothetical protein